MPETIYRKDTVNKKIFVTREFAAPVEKVWAAWTERNLLDQWWAPKPWKAKTKSLDFKEGGFWLYAMVGPDGSQQWCQVDFTGIAPMKQFTAINGFCDEDGNRTTGMADMYWKCDFISSATGTTVEVEITFETETDMQTIIGMGFQEGFAAGLGNLDELLAQ